VTPSSAANQPAPTAAPEQPDPPKSTALSRRWLVLDRLGVLQVLGAIALSLIAHFSSYNHITLFGRTIALQQQWGIPFIAASLETVGVVAEVATRSWLRAVPDAVRAAEARERCATGVLVKEESPGMAQSLFAYLNNSSNDN
jgi:predicted MFS family arabinose efflux permease